MMNKGVIGMAKDRGLKTRKPFSTNIQSELGNSLDKLSNETKITKSKLLDEAITDLLKKYGKNY